MDCWSWTIPNGSLRPAFDNFQPVLTIPFYTPTVSRRPEPLKAHYRNVHIAWEEMDGSLQYEVALSEGRWLIGYFHTKRQLPFLSPLRHYSVDRTLTMILAMLILPPTFSCTKRYVQAYLSLDRQVWECGRERVCV